jgi:hypothetical protein|tara:strand:+ start:372 stop:518 length:147 start_codon:yes stop_codon:yes gene_type:complete
MKKGGFRNQARKQETRNKIKFNFRKQQIKLREQLDYYGSQKEKEINSK